MNTIVLSSFAVDSGNAGTVYRCEVRDDNRTRELRYVVNSTTGHPRPCTNANWAAMGMLLPAMRRGKTLRISHGLSDLLLHFLRTDIQDLLINFDSGLQRIEIEADIVAAEDRPSGRKRVGTGFSAGVDSFSALRAFQSSGISKSLDISDLMTFSVGAFGERNGNGSREIFKTAAARTASYAERFEIDAHSVASNLTDFYAGIPGLDFIRTHTLRNASAATLFERELDAYLYASTFAYTELDLSAKYDLAHIDPLLLPLLSTTELRFISSGAGTDRVRKTAQLADDEDARELLDVCVTPAPKRAALVGYGLNCSRCWKCYRTMVTLDALDRLDKFALVFDLDHYRANKEGVLTTLENRGRKGSKLDQAAVDLFRKSIILADH